MISLRRISLPDFGAADEIPALPVSTYLERLALTIDRMRVEGLDVLAIYADREHSANLNFLIGFDPRFEEALFLMDRSGKRLLLVGNECSEFLPRDELQIESELFQEFSLLGQPRDSSRPLLTILRDFGIRGRTVVGCVGWKYYDRANFHSPETTIEIPSYLVDAFRLLTDDNAQVRNANALLMNPYDGLRLRNSVHQLARFEYAGTKTSESILSALKHLKVGCSEKILERFYDSGGLPLNCHAMASFGEKARRELASPSDTRAKLGEPYTMALGVEGALTRRAGMIARGPEELSDSLKTFYPQFASNYFETVATWYESIAVGANGGAVYDRVQMVTRKDLFQLALNPGHYIHLDEWMSTPFFKGSQATLPSGAALQADLIPLSKGPFCCANAEDGVALADEKLRQEFASTYPAAWNRIQLRRAFMRDTLGIKLDQSVLPLSNIPGWFAPYALNRDYAFIKH
ncbi:aminopeptidase P family N-terminal domain-containing protein [Planctomicrobium sp. SH664]|uniref:aminopeptidase P family N-terminal domain-containing protein n=1 Tax=Planctomicrobium sp. SH664 TaxID=3448125 RepID=UPI003F5B06B1